MENEKSRLSECTRHEDADAYGRATPALCVAATGGISYEWPHSSDDAPLAMETIHTRRRAWLR
eukprot:4148391-Pyramimonas_sp.AAC.1